MAPVALALAVLRQPGGAADIGPVLAARGVSLVIFLLISGAISDRFSRTQVLAISNLSSAGTQGTVALILLTGAYHTLTITVLEFLNGAVSAFTLPAARGLLPQLVEASARQKANSLLGTANYTSAVLGPAVCSAIVFDPTGGTIIAVDAMCFLISGICICLIKLPAMNSIERESTFGEIRRGWQGFCRQSWIWTVVLAFSMLNCIRAGAWYVLGPIAVTAASGPSVWGTVIAGQGIGILSANLLMVKLRVRRLLSTGSLWAATLGGVPMLMVGLHSDAGFLIVGAFLGGLGLGIFGIAWETSLQEHVPSHLLSRISAYDNIGSFVAMPIGQIGIVPLASACNSTTIELTAAVLYVTIGIAPLLSADVRALRQP